jgi:H+/Cl- antiporter ClcA
LVQLGDPDHRNGLVGGFSAVAFLVLSQIHFRWLWIEPSHSLGWSFIPISLAAIVSTALIAGFILTYVSREAAGSGIPQVKAAFWRDFGYLPFRVVLAKFFGCVITIGGGSSLGREGPTVHIAGALASNVAGLIGVVFQKGALIWRDHIKNYRRIRLALKPAIGAMVNWICGIIVFLAIAHIGVFGLGYNDLQDMLAGRITGIQAVILAVAKLAATIAVYAWGGAGGIFSPTLVLCAAAGLALSQLFSLATHLPPNEQLALTVAGMSACLGAVVRAPITSILIVFEMTHQFAFVPLLMIGALASQAVSRAFCHTNFYSEILERDGIDLDQHIPIKSWATQHIF